MPLTGALATPPARRQSPVPRAIGAAAAAALREELRTDPKPGLVGPHDRGAHRDMNARTFLASIAALRGYFDAVARGGMEGVPLAALRALALDAEARMLRATDGVNTHRGAIFTIGLLAAAAGQLHAERAGFDAAALRDTLRRRFGPMILRELPLAVASHGAIVRRRHGAGGARAEAAAGFPHLFEVVLPALDGSLRRGAPRCAAAVHGLMSAVAVLPDTNLLYRGGVRGLAFARAAARDFLAAGSVHRTGWKEHARAVHREFVARNLSPGGSADLLAGALFVDRLRALEGPRESGG